MRICLVNLVLVEKLFNMDQSMQLSVSEVSVYVYFQSNLSSSTMDFYRILSVRKIQESTNVV